MDPDPKDDAEAWEKVRRENPHIDDLPPGERDQGLATGYWRRERGEEGREEPPAR